MKLRQNRRGGGWRTSGDGDGRFYRDYQADGSGYISKIAVEKVDRKMQEREFCCSTFDLSYLMWLISGKCLKVNHKLNSLPVD